MTMAAGDSYMAAKAAAKAQLKMYSIVLANEVIIYCEEAALSINRK